MSSAADHHGARATPVRDASRVDSTGEGNTEHARPGSQGSTGSLERSLQWALGLLVVAVLLSLTGTGLWIGRTGAEQFVAARLAHDAEALIAGLDLDSREIGGPLPPVYNQPFSGHYYLVRFDDGRVSRSRSLWDHQIQVEILAPGLTVMERHDGPRGQRLLLWRAGFEKQGVAFTVAVAEDMTQLLDTLWRLLWVGVGLSLCGTLTLLFVQRWLLRRGFGQVAAVRCRRSSRSMAVNFVSGVPSVLADLRRPSSCQGRRVDPAPDQIARVLFHRTMAATSRFSPDALALCQRRNETLPVVGYSAFQVIQLSVC